MELRKESVQMLQIKSRAASQVTFDTDYNVPDAKPDVGRLIQSKGDISMDEVRLSEGKAFISGNLNVDILYVGEENQKVSSLGAKLSFDETLNLEGIATVSYTHLDVYKRQVVFMLHSPLIRRPAGPSAVIMDGTP